MKRSALKRKSPLRAKKADLRRRKKSRRPERIPKDRGPDVYGEHHRWINRQPCLLSRFGAVRSHVCIGLVRGHHLKTVGSGGKDRDNEVPLCTGAHSEVHTIGRARFEKKHQLEPLTFYAAAYTEAFDRTHLTRTPEQHER